MSDKSKREIILVTGITALAAFFRFLSLDTLPPGFQFDQAFYVLDVLQLHGGDFRVFFPAPGLSEPLYQYLLLPAIAIFGGDTSFGLKLTGAIIGIMTIPVIYGLTRTVFQSRLIATLGAFCAAISFWNIFYNRYGERIPLTVLTTTLTLWLLWRALDRLRMRDFIDTGILCGLCLYTYPSARVVPLIMTSVILLRALRDRSRVTLYVRGLAIALGTAMVVFLPLGLYYLWHPDDFIAHAAQVSIFVPHGNVRGNILESLLDNAGKLLGMFFIAGDPGVLRNLPGRPIFDPLQAILFCIGTVVFLFALARPRAERLNFDRAVLMVVWLGAGLGLSLISDDAPNFGRIQISMPVVMILPAWGAFEIWKRLQSPLQKRAALAAFGAILAFGTWSTYRDYFIVFANSPDTYYAFDTDKVETARWLNSQSLNQQIFLAPLLATNGTISLLTRNAPLKSFDSRDTIVLPGNSSRKDALYAFPWEQDKRVQTMLARLNGLGLREEVRGSKDGILLLNVRVPAAYLPDAQNPLPQLTRTGGFLAPQKTTHTNWSDQFGLLGYTLEPEGPGGRNLVVTLYLHARAPIARDYTFSVKALDARDRVWGQEDKWAGDNSYATTHWSAGDVVIEKFYPGLNACAPAGEYRLSIEAYDPLTMQTLDLADGAGNIAYLETTRADASSGNRIEDLEIAKPLDLKIGVGLNLLGYSLSSEQLKPADPFSLSLIWRGKGNGSREPLTISVRDAANQETQLVQSTVALPPEGRGLCSFFDLALPANLVPNHASLLVNNIRVATLQISK